MLDESSTQRVWLLLQANQFGKAEEIARKAISENVEDTDAWLCLAWCLYQSDDLDGALECAAEALRLAPNYADCFNLIGWIYAGMGKHHAAITMAKKAAAIEPNNISHHELLAIVYAYSERPRKARKWAERALSINPHSLSAMNAKGHALVSLGYRREGEMCFRDALAIDPTDEQSQLNYGESRRRFGNAGEAERVYRDVLRENANSQDAKRLLFEVNAREKARYLGPELALTDRIQDVVASLYWFFASPYLLFFGICYAAIPVLVMLAFYEWSWRPLIEDVDHPIPAVGANWLYGLFWLPTVGITYGRLMARWGDSERYDDPPPWFADVSVPLLCFILAGCSHIMLSRTVDAVFVVLLIIFSTLLLSAGLTFAFGKPFSPRTAQRFAWCVLALFAIAPILCASFGFLISSSAEILFETNVGRWCLYPIPFLPLIVLVAVGWDLQQA